MVFGHHARCVYTLAAVYLCMEGRVHGSPPIRNPPSKTLAQQYKACADLLRSGQFLKALECEKTGVERAAAVHDEKYRLVFLTGAGTAQSALYRYRDAIGTLNEASALAREIGWTEYVGITGAILANVYSRLGETDLAYAEASRGVAAVPAAKDAHTRAQLLVMMAEVKYLAGEKGEALRLFRTGIDEAKRGGEHAVIADALSRMGHSMLERGDTDEAEKMLNESFEIRRTRALPGLDASYLNLGTLRLQQHKPDEALEFFDRAAAAARGGTSRVTAWAIYFGRGEALRAAGKLEPALDSLELAIQDIRRRRDDIVPVDGILANADVKFQQVYSAYVETAMRLSEQRHDAQLSERAFAVSEENRARSVRQSRAWRERLPARYWDVLAEARSLEVAEVSSSAESANDRLRALRAELARLEAAAGLELPQEKSENTRERSALLGFQRSLRPGEALLSFYVGRDESYLWALSNQGLEVRRLPTREHLASRIAAFRAAVAANSPGLKRAAADLYAEVFPALPKHVLSARHWALSLDDNLFELPFAALHESTQFVVERHSLRIVPSAYMLRGKAIRAHSARFLAVADPVYNRADSRWRSYAKTQAPYRTTWLSRFFETEEDEPKAALELTRIPASATEAQTCAREWTVGAATLLTGPDANRGRIARELAAKPAVVHFSVHVVAHEPAPQRAYIALGLQPDGKADLLTPTEISRRELGVALVVLSGCSSGRGEALPGAGLTGLTRAWLLSGSHAVIASHWPTPDDTGALFRSFYRDLRSRYPVIDGRTCASSLQQAQVAMLRSGTWRSQPRYWAAFFLVGRN